jgi:hypothetical protein
VYRVSDNPPVGAFDFCHQLPFSSHRIRQCAIVGFTPDAIETACAGAKYILVQMHELYFNAIDALCPLYGSLKYVGRKPF